MEDLKGPVNYIMHQEVLKPMSATTKLRVVTALSITTTLVGPTTLSYPKDLTH